MQRHLRTLVLSLSLAAGLSVGLTGCGPKATPVTIPGAVNTADAQIYVALSDLQAGIIAAQGQQAAHPTLKPILDSQIGPNYTRARDAAEAYHRALLAGQPADSTKSAAILAQVQAVAQALTAALRQVGVTK